MLFGMLAGLLVLISICSELTAIVLQENKLQIDSMLLARL